MRHALESYKHLQSTVGKKRARELSRAEIVARLARRLAGPGWSAVQSPSLDRLTESMPTVTSAEEVLAWAGLSPARVGELLAEFEEVPKALVDRYATANLTWPEVFAVEASTSAILYCLVRELQPARMVETGIANGHSSFVILSAMHANGVGQLVSVDISHDTGALVTDELAERWTRVIIDDQRPGLSVLQERVGSAPVQLFFHDGDHRFLGQMLDYHLADRLLTPDGLLMSDDINTTSAWVDAQASGLLGHQGLVLIDRRKAVGFARPHQVG